MKFEKGQVWLNGLNQRVVIISVDAGEPHPVIGEVELTRGFHTVAYSGEGQYHSRARNAHLDLDELVT